MRFIRFIVRPMIQNSSAATNRFNVAGSARIKSTIVLSFAQRIHADDFKSSDSAIARQSPVDASRVNCATRMNRNGAAMTNASSEKRCDIEDPPGQCSPKDHWSVAGFRSVGVGFDANAVSRKASSKRDLAAKTR
jgi:hypothetical protein